MTLGLLGLIGNQNAYLAETDAITAGTDSDGNTIVPNGLRLNFQGSIADVLAEIDINGACSVAP
ncbi:MAG: hypothetical protein QM661_13280 [Solimonas sp.]